MENLGNDTMDGPINSMNIYNHLLSINNSIIYSISFTAVPSQPSLSLRILSNLSSQMRSNCARLLLSRFHSPPLSFITLAFSYLSRLSSAATSALS